MEKRDFDLMREELVLGLATLGLVGDDFSESKINLLMLYIKELSFWNSKMNLVGRFDGSFIARHILDSLAVYPKLVEVAPKSVADVGTGAGLPGVVLAIFYDKAEFTLIERSGKKCGFLRNCVALLGLGSRVTVIEAPVEEVKESFDLVTFRAFRQFTDYYHYLIAILNENGSIFAYKGKKETILSEIKEVGLSVDEISLTELKVPGLNEERYLLAF